MREGSTSSPTEDSRLMTTQFQWSHIPLVALFFILTACEQQHSTYYVTTTGDDAHSGLSENEAWKTFQHAITIVKPGDSVFIKAGRYTNNHLYLSGSSGTQQSPITFIGYYQTPGDLYPDNFKPHRIITPKLPDHNEIPTIDGEFKNNHYSGIELNNSHYIHLKNIHVTGYQSNISLYMAEHNLLQNIIVSKAKDALVYTGFGLRLNRSNHNTLQYIRAISNQGENISFKLSNYNLLENCQSHGGLPGDDDGENDGTDYYIVITQSHHNTIRKCLAQRHSSIEHGGHGIGIKAKGVDSYKNKIVDSVVRGMSKGFYVNHQQTFDNEFINCAAYGDETIAGLISNGFIARDGAHNNTFTGCKGLQLDHSIAFTDSAEDGGLGQEQNNNLFSACEFNQTLQSIIWFGNSAHNNIFDNITANEAPRLVTFSHNTPQHDWSNNILKDSQLYNVNAIGLNPIMNAEELALQLHNVSINIHRQH